MKVNRIKYYKDNMKRGNSAFVVISVVLVLSVSLAFGEDPFFDNFDRKNGKPGNDWIINSPEVKTEIKDKEILIHGTEKTNWKRNGIERLVDDISKVCFEFLNNKVGQMRISAFILFRNHKEKIISTQQVLWITLGVVGLISVGSPFEKNPRKEWYVSSAY